MRIMPIQQNQVSYQGTLRFRNQEIKSGYGESDPSKMKNAVSCATINADLIESIDNYSSSDYLDDKKYKSVIRLASGLSYGLQVPYEDVVAAYEKVLKDAGNKVSWDGLTCKSDLGN